MMRPSAGFTLLELVLVLFILGLLATVSTSFIENEDGQLRFDDSLQRLDAVPDAVYNRESLSNSPVLSGFVVDNGRLPPDPAAGHQLTPLIRQDGVWDAGDDVWLDRQPRVAHLSTVATEFDPIDDLLDPQPLFVLSKGFRGAYLDRAAIDRNNEYRDAWGDEFPVTATAADYTVSYDGNATGAQPKPSPFDQVVSRSLVADDWSIPLSEIDITVLNQRAAGNDLPETGSELTTWGALVVFENNAELAEAQRWKTYHFALGTLNVGDDLNTITDVSQWFLNGDTTAVDPALERIPAGRHLFLVADDPSGAGIDTVYGGVQFLVIPRSTQPSVTLELTGP